MSMVLTRRPPTITCRRLGAPADFADCCPSRRLHPVKTTPAAAPAASLKNSRRLDIGLSLPEENPARLGHDGGAVRGAVRGCLRRRVGIYYFPLGSGGSKSRGCGRK